MKLLVTVSEELTPMELIEALEALEKLPFVSRAELSPEEIPLTERSAYYTDSYLTVGDAPACAAPGNGL